MAERVRESRRAAPGDPPVLGDGEDGVELVGIQLVKVIDLSIHYG